MLRGSVRRSTPTTSRTTPLRESTSRRSSASRLKVNSFLVSCLPCSAAVRMRSRSWCRGWPGSSSAWSVEAKPMMVCRLMLKSWAMPAVRVPRASIFWDWISCCISSWFLRAASRRAVTSRMEASTSCLPSTAVAEREISSGTGCPPLCQPSSSRVVPTTPRPRPAKKSLMYSSCCRKVSGQNRQDRSRPSICSGSCPKMWPAAGLKTTMVPVSSTTIRPSPAAAISASARAACMFIEDDSANDLFQIVCLGDNPILWQPWYQIPRTRTTEGPKKRGNHGRNEDSH